MSGGEPNAQTQARDCTQGVPQLFSQLCDLSVRRPGEGTMVIKQVGQVRG